MGYVACIREKINAYKIEKDVEVSSHDYLMVLSQHLPRGTETG
jgi:hypothetical protein